MRGLDPANLTRRFRGLLDQAGLRRIRFHDLRHLTATLLLEQGVELVVIKELLATPTSRSPPTSTPTSNSASNATPSNACQVLSTTAPNRSRQKTITTSVAVKRVTGPR
ncbi:MULTISPECIES: tyrosine-type recombinase/integrase [Streptosporangium]|uniref:tyrosine-type recombinase/integrase n=1 Tax=Streptosporangium TaxID=2000 RepID=UPI0035230071